MKILVVQDADWNKKGPHQQHHLMERLSLRGHEIVVIGFDQLWEGGGFFSRRKENKDICRFYEGAKIKFIKPFFIKTKVLDYISFLFSSRVEIKNYVDGFDPDIVIGFTSVISNYWGMYYANKNGIPFIYYWTDVIHTLIPFKLFQQVGKIIEKNIIKNSAMVLAINEILKDQVISLGAKESLTEVVPGGIDSTRFNPSKIDSIYFKKKYNISNDDKLLFFMGWIYKFSGLKEVILELDKVKDIHPKLKLMIVGEGEYYAELQSLVKDLEIEDRVIMTGLMPYEDIPNLISCSDICLLPAYNNEIMRHIVPIKIYEYLSMHKTVISTELPGVMKEFGHGNGVIYVKKPDEIINKVSSMSLEEIEYNKKASKLFIEKYDWNEIIISFENILKILSKKTNF